MIAVESARITDTAPQVRFNPLAMIGRAELTDGVWSADLGFSLPDGPALATARLRHVMASGEGGVEIDTRTLAFTEGGLQPARISPLAAAAGSPVTGQARFVGRFDWTPAGTASKGQFAIPRMDFQSPLGGVRGLSGEIDFTSLAPLIATPGQTLRVESLQTIAPVTDATVTFGLKDGVLSVTDGEAAVSGGRVRIETLEVPLAADQPVRGVLLLDGAQLHDLVEASPFGDQVELDARVSGRVPFEARGSRVRILGGELKAMQPGHLSIRRTALTGVAAVGGVAKGLRAAPPPATSETFTDFAYQAMENLPSPGSTPRSPATKMGGWGCCSTSLAGTTRLRGRKSGSALPNSLVASSWDASCRCHRTLA